MTRNSLTLAILLLAVVSGSADAREFRLRVMTYNVGGATYLDLSPEGVRRLAGEIVDNRVDVAGLTEVDLGTDWFDGRDILAELRVALANRGYPMFIHQSTQYPYQGGYAVHGFLSRYPIEESKTWRLDENTGWILDRITIEPIYGLRIHGYNSHFPVGLQGDEPLVKKCLSLVNEATGPHFLMGDLNIGYNDPEFERVAAEAGLENTCRLANDAPCLSVGYSAAIVAPFPLGGQIDHILVADIPKVTRSWTHFSSISDHWPVIAEFAFDMGDSLLTIIPETRRPVPYTNWDKAMEHWVAGDFIAAVSQLNGAVVELDYPTDPRIPGKHWYTAGEMFRLAEDRDSARKHYLITCSFAEKTYWSTWAMQRLAILDRDSGNCEGALEMLERFVVAYYEYVHDYPLDRTIEMVYSQMQTCNKDLDRNTYLTHLAETNTGRPVARAAHYALAMDALKSDDDVAWEKHYYAAKIDKKDLFQFVTLLADLTGAMARTGHSEEADWLVENRLLPKIRGESYKRNALGRYWVDRYPEDYKVSLNPGQPVEVPLSGDRHIVRETAGADTSGATLTLLLRDDTLRMTVAVRDATHLANWTDADIWRGDSLQVAIDPGATGGQVYDASDTEFGLALTGKGTTAWFWKKGHADATVDALIERSGDITRYRVDIPFRLLIGPHGEHRAGVNLVVNDNDGDERVGFIEWTPGIVYEKAPEMFPVLHFESQ